MEKNRRANLRGHLEALKSVLPPESDTHRDTTLSLLTRARNYIKVGRNDFFDKFLMIFSSLPSLLTINPSIFSIPFNESWLLENLSLTQKEIFFKVIQG